MSRTERRATEGRSTEKVSVFRRFLAYGKQKGHVAPFLASCILALGGAVMNLIGPNYLGEMAAAIQAGLAGAIDLGLIQRLGIFLALIYLIGFALSFSQGFIIAGVIQNISKDLREDLSRKIDRLPLSYLDARPNGETISLFSNDIDSLNMSLNQSFSSIVSSVAQLLGSAVMMFATNWQMAAAGIAAALLGTLLTSGIIRKSQPHFAEQQQALAAVDDQVEEVAGSLDVVRISNGAAQERSRFTGLNQRLAVANERSTFLSSLMMPLMIFIGNFAYVAVCLVGGALAIQGSISFGVVVAFMVYIRLFTQPLQNISQAASSIETIAAALERIFGFLDEEELADESGKTEHLGQVRDPATGAISGTPVKGDVQFHHVKFSYVLGHEIIHDFSAELKAGQKVALVGPTGAGKTTMVNLLMRFYELDHGSIRIDGVRTRDVTRENVHDQFAMVLQDTWFFQGTLRENIAFKYRRGDRRGP